MPRVNRSKKRLRVREKAWDLGTSFNATQLDEVIEELRELKKEVESRGYSDLTLEFQPNWDDPSEMVIFGTRDETEKEYAKRMKAIENEKRQEQVALQEHIKKVEAEAKRLGLIKP